jgi:hypothetical protein
VSFNHVSPAFYIGLGGSGSDVVNRVAGKLKSRWNWDEMKDLVHFFAVDTNTHDLEKHENIPRENRLLISDFDKRTYIQQKRGETYRDEDDFVTQWVHDWYDFRGTRGAGAGQIRIESRLGLHYQLEEDRGKIVQRFKSAINESLDHDIPYRQNEPPQFEVFTYGSVAGGTGSGSFLPIAYLMKDLIRDVNWIPQVIGNLMLPSLFLNKVPRTLHADINANGYAALKELEHLMKLDTEGGAQREEFHYNPQRRHNEIVEEGPYDFVYVADKPSTFEIEEYKNAIADAAYLLLYSPLLGAQESNLDNYEKHQKGTASGYSMYYGSNNCAVLILPDRDLLEYCAYRYAAHAMEEYLLFRGSDDFDESFAIDFQDPQFQRLSKQAQAEKIDEKFVSFIEYMARQEREDDIEGGPYQAVESLETPTGSDLGEEFDRLVEDFRQQVREKVDLHTLSSTDIVESNIKTDSEVNDLRDEINRSRTAIRSLWDTVRQEIERGDTIQSFFETHGANPYAQRLFLIRTKEELNDRIDELSNKIDSISEEVDLSSDHVSEEISHHRDRLEETAELTIMERIKGENTDFINARNNFLNYFNGTLVDGNRELIVSEFEIEYLRAMLEHFEQRLDSFRSVASQAAESIQNLTDEAERARQTGRFPDGEGESNAYTLDVEALKEIGGDRLWDYFFEDRFVAEGRAMNYFDEAEIFSIITEAFNPGTDEKGRRRSKNADEITEEIKDELIEVGRERLESEIVGTRDGGSDMSQKGLLLNEALEYEAKYHFRKQFEQDNREEDPNWEQIEEYLKSKFQFCADKSDPLATFTQNEHPDVVNAKSTYIGLHGAYDEELGRMVDEVAPHANMLPNWYDEKSIVFYTANMNIPLFYYKRLNDEMKHEYRRVMEDDPGERGYPIHIQADWEEALPDLDPTDRVEEQRQEQRHERLVDFSIGLACGVFEERTRGGEVFWHAGDYSERLGDDLVDAFESLGDLDERTSRKLERTIEQARKGIADGTGVEAIEQLDAFVDELDDRIWELERSDAMGARRILDFLTQQEEAIESWQASLE